MNKVTVIDGSSKAMPNAYLLGALGIAIPMLIALYWPLYWAHPVRTPQVFRPAMLLLSALLAFICGRQRLTRTETKLAGTLAAICCLWLATAFAATDVPRALDGWVKMVVLCLVCVFMSRALRDPVIAKTFGYALIVASVLISVFIVVAYVRFEGWAIPTYESSRRLKGLASNMGISLNAIAFTAVVAYVNGACLMPKSWFTWLIGVVVLIVGSVFTGSRAPLGVFVLTGFVLLIAKGLSARSLFQRCSAIVVCAAVLAGAIFALETLSFKKMSDMTEGRWDLWYVALQKFSERPLVGYGFGSVDDDLFARTPGVYPLPRRHDGQFPGGYHNEFLGTLAEEGLIGFAGLVVLYWFLMRSCWELSFRKWATWHKGEWAFVGGLFLLIRAGVEIPGLFGYANGPPDFQAYIFLAFIVSRFSIEEDFARKTVKPAASPSFQDISELPRKTFETQGMQIQ